MLGVVQIAGVLARRIICRVKRGEQLEPRRAIRFDHVRLANGHLFAGAVAGSKSRKGKE